MDNPKGGYSDLTEAGSLRRIRPLKYIFSKGSLGDSFEEKIKLWNQMTLLSDN